MAPRSSTIDASKVGPAYRNLLRHFAFYAEYHNDPVNQWIHIVCVPLLLATAFVFLAPVNLAPYVPAGITSFLTSLLKGPAPLDAATLVAAGYAAYYVYLTPSPLGVAAVGMVAALCTGAHAFVSSAGPAAWRPALALHIVCWLAQFYGHGAHERRSPALLDNLFQALFMAPIFVLMEALFKVGALRGFQDAVAPEVAQRIREHKARKGRTE